MLTKIDLVTILVYFVAVILIGYFASRKQTDESFLIAERKLGIISAVSTINATKTGAIIFIFTASLYQYGLAAIWYFVGVCLGYLVFIPFAVKLFRESRAGYYTLADYFRSNYGLASYYVAVFITVLTMISMLAINLIAATKTLVFFTGMNFAMAAVIIAAVVMTYLLLAGFDAVVKTDVLQYIAIVFILLAFAFILLQRTAIPASEWSIFMANGSDMLGFLLIGVLFPFAAPDLWQRVYAMSDTKTLKKSMLYSIFSFAVVAFILAVVGLAIKTALPGADPDLALVQGLHGLLPAGLAGLAVVMFFAALMSSIDTYAYTASSSLIQDLIRGISKKKTVFLIRLCLIGVIAVGTLMSILIQDLLRASFIFVAFVVTLAIPTIATWIKPRINKATLDIALVFGTALLIVLVALGIAQNNLDPSITVKGIGSSLLGLFIGFVYSWARKRWNRAHA